MKALKKCNVPMLVAALAALAMFIVGSFFDEPISAAFYNKYQLNIPVFSLIIVLLGPLVTNALGVFAGSSLLVVESPYSKKLNILFRIIGGLAVAGISFFAYTSGNELRDVIPGITRAGALAVDISIFAIIVFMDIAIFILVWKFNNKFDQYSLLWVSLTMVAVIAITSASGEVIKYLASRPRPRIYFIGIESYKDWWEWRPLYAITAHVSESKSFISGHSSNGASITVLLPLFLSLTKLGEKKHTATLAAITGVLYAFVVGLSRIFAIAHFMSDVAGGFILSFILGGVITRLMLLIQKKVEDKSPTSN